ncbi:MAG: AAA family ATPase [Thermoanaerobaculia bacterium]
MLTDLTVRNLAVLEEASVAFGPGLNVLTGETGAGKSIVVDALALLAGARASSDLVRTGSDTLVVAGRFDSPAGAAWDGLLEEAGLAVDGDEILVRREINREGRNRVYVNDQPVTLALLRRLTGPLLRIHAQRDELELASPEQQRALLDLAGGGEAGERLAQVAEAWEAYRVAAERLERVAGDERLRQERMDLLRFQVQEIEAAGLTAGEEDDLRAERQWLRHAEAIGQALGGSLDLLYETEESVVDRLARAERTLEEIGEWLQEAAQWAGELSELRIRAEEVARGVRDRLEGAEADPARLDAVEARLAQLERLFRKYGAGSRDLLERATEMRRGSRIWMPTAATARRSKPAWRRPSEPTVGPLPASPRPAGAGWMSWWPASTGSSRTWCWAMRASASSWRRNAAPAARSRSTGRVSSSVQRAGTG